MKKAFTLIELLVVIAIIAILASILFPVFAKVREKARQTACLSNEKQIGLGILQYSADFDDKLPSGAGQDGQGAGWDNEVYPYINSVSVFTCPDDTTVAGGVNTPVSYFYNMNLALNIRGGVNFFTPNLGVGNSQLSAPGMTVMLCEGASDPADITAPPNNATFSSPSIQLASTTDGDDGTNAGTPNNIDIQTGYLGGNGANPGRFTASAPTAAFPNPLGRHTGGSNFLLADGHAKWLRGSQVSAGAWAGSQTSDEGIVGAFDLWPYPGGDTAGNCPNGAALCVAAGTGFSSNSQATGAPYAATFSPE